MSNAYTNQDKSFTQCNDFGWQEIIGAAEGEIDKCEQRIRSLREAIAIARRKIDAGEPYEAPRNHRG